jgi:hypothetical protein
VPFFSFFLYAPWLNAGYATRLIKCGKVWSGKCGLKRFCRLLKIFIDFQLAPWVFLLSVFCGVVGCLWCGLSKWVTTARRRLGSKRVASGAFGDSRGLLADWSCLGAPRGLVGARAVPQREFEQEYDYEMME